MTSGFSEAALNSRRQWSNSLKHQTKKREDGQGTGAQETRAAAGDARPSRRAGVGLGHPTARLWPARSGQLLGRRGLLALAPPNTGSLEVLVFKAFSKSKRGGCGGDSLRLLAGPLAGEPTTSHLRPRCRAGPAAGGVSKKSVLPAAACRSRAGQSGVLIKTRHLFAHHPQGQKFKVRAGWVPSENLWPPHSEEPSGPFLCLQG